MKSRTVSWPVLVAICIVALSVRAFWATFVHAVPLSDFGYYYQQAHNLLVGAGYTAEGKPTAFWPPGYSFMLLAFFRVFGESLTTAKAAGIVLWTISAALTYVLGLRLGGRLTAGIAGFTVALFPEFIFYGNLVASENLFIPLLLGALLALSPAEKLDEPPSWKHAAIAGVLLGCAVLTRSTAVLVPPLIALVLVLWFRSRQALVSAAVLLVAFAIALSPWIIRNAVRMNAPVLSTNGGVSLWTGNNELATGGIQQKGPYPTFDRSTPAREVATSSEYTHKALAFIVEHPAQFVALVPAKASRLFAAPVSIPWSEMNLPQPGVPRYRKLDRRERRVIGFANSLGVQSPAWMITLWILGFVGAVYAVVRRSSVGLWVLVLAAYWLVFHTTLGNGQARYLVSVAPLLAVTAAYLVALPVNWAVGRAREASPVASADA